MHHIINSIRSDRERFTMSVIDKDGQVLDDEIAFKCGRAAAFCVRVIEAVDEKLDVRGVIDSFLNHMSTVKRVLEVKQEALEGLREEQLRHPGHYYSDIYRAKVLCDRSKKELDDLVHYYTHWDSIPKIRIYTETVVVAPQVVPELNAAAQTQAPWTLDSLSPQQRRYSK